MRRDDGSLKTGRFSIAIIICAVVLFAAVLLGIGGIFNAAGFSYDNADKYEAGDTQIHGTVKNLDINWVNGKVHIAYHDGENIGLSEISDKAISPDYQMRWWLDGDTLRVQYSKSGFRFGRKWNQQKELTISLPREISFENVDISATSGDLDIPSLKTEELDLSVTSGDIMASAEASKISVSGTSGDIHLDTAKNTDEILVTTTSGIISLDVLNAEKVRVSNTSGGININARQIMDLDADSTSGDISAQIQESDKTDISSTSGDISVLLNGIGNLDIDTTSGNVEVSLPEKTGFTANIDTTSGKVKYDLPLTKDGSSYICGDGSASVNINTTSGDVRILPAAQE